MNYCLSCLSVYDVNLIPSRTYRNGILPGYGNTYFIFTGFTDHLRSPVLNCVVGCLFPNASSGYNISYCTIINIDYNF